MGRFVCYFELYLSHYVTYFVLHSYSRQFEQFAFVSFTLKRCV